MDKHWIWKRKKKVSVYLVLKIKIKPKYDNNERVPTKFGKYI